MTSEAALTRLAAASAEAIPAALATYGVADVQVGLPVIVAEDGADPFATLPAPGVVTSVAYGGGVAGGATLGVSRHGARALAAAMMGQDPSALQDDGAELSELELSAAAEAMEQVMAAAAGATGAVLDADVAIGVPDTRAVATAAEAAAAGERASSCVVVTGLTVLGQPARLVQVVPDAFLVRMTRPPDEPAAEVAGPAGPAAAAAPAADPGGAAATIGDAVLGTKLRVWAEVGRVRLPVGRVVSLPAGSVLELDRLAEDPVDVFVNGHRYATGRLVVDDGGDWAVRLESILPAATTPAAS